MDKTRIQILADKYYSLVDDLKRIDKEKEYTKREIILVLKEIELQNKTKR